MQSETSNDQKLIPANAMDLLLDMVCAVDGQGRFVYVSAACERMLGYHAEELTGKVMMDYVHPDDRESTRAVADRVMQEERLLHMAHFDPLTGLPNRLLFEDRFTTALYRAIRDGEQVGLLYMDLVGFKATNDTLGHEAGDNLLRQVGARLSGCLRASDTVGRPGGDEFTALLVNSGGAEQVRGVMHKIQVAMEEEFTIGGHPVTVSVSIGMALYPDDGTDTATLYRVADRAMYASRAVSMPETGSLSGR